MPNEPLEDNKPNWDSQKAQRIKTLKAALNKSDQEFDQVFDQMFQEKATATRGKPSPAD